MGLAQVNQTVPTMLISGVGGDSGKDSPPSVKLSQRVSLEKKWSLLRRSGMASQRRQPYVFEG